jgi:hypothetical protein
MSELRVDNIVSQDGTAAPVYTQGLIVGSGKTFTVIGDVDFQSGANVSGVVTFSTLSIASGFSVTGVVTATSFSGNLTGNVTGNVTGNATGLSGSPNITVTNVSAQDVQVGGALTVTGNLTVNGTQTIINTTNVEITDPLVGIGSGNTTDSQADGDGIQVYGATPKTFTYNDTKKSFEANIPIAPNESRFITGAEKTALISGNTASLTYNSSSANVAICTNATGNITLDVNGIPTSSDFDNHAITFTVIATSTSGVARTCTAVNMNGVSKTIKWAGGSLANAVSGLTTTAGYTIFGFTGINTLGSASTAANYEVFGVASGGFF